MAEGVSKPDFAPRRGARPIAGGERSEPPELEIGEKSPGRGETILSFAPSGLLCIRIHTGGSQKALAPGSLSCAPPGRLRLILVLQQSRPLAPMKLQMAGHMEFCHIPKCSGSLNFSRIGITAHVRLNQKRGIRRDAGGRRSTHIPYRASDFLRVTYRIIKAVISCAHARAISAGIMLCVASRIMPTACGLA